MTLKALLMPDVCDDNNDVRSGGYVFKAILCHCVEGQYHTNDGHPLQKVFTAWNSLRKSLEELRHSE